MGRSGVAAAGCGATRRGAPTWTTQLQALTWKNYALSIRLCRTTACEFLAPICCMLLLGILDHQVRYGRPEVTPGAFASFKRNEGPLPCLVFDDQSGIYGYGLPITGAWCVPVLFAPTTAPDVMQIMGRAASLNGYAAPANFSGDASIPGGPVACGGESRTATRQCMLGFSSVSAMKVWLKANPGRAAVGIVFGDTSRLVAGDGTSYTASVVTDSLPPTDVSYEIWYNESAVKNKWYANAGEDALGAFSVTESSSRSSPLVDTSFMLRAQRMVDEAILAWRAHSLGRSASDVSLELELRPYPRVRDQHGQTLTQVFGALFVYLSLMFSFLLTLTRIVSEKERHVAGAMRSIGMRDSAYWWSYYLWTVTTAILVAAIVYLIGLAFQLPMFKATEFGVIFSILLLYILTINAVAFFLASLLQKVRSASIVGVALLLAGAVFAILCQNPTESSIAYIWWEKHVPSFVSTLVQIVFPVTSLIKLLADITVVTTATMSFNQTTTKMQWEGGAPFGWSELRSLQLNRTAIFFDEDSDPPDFEWFVPPPPVQALGNLAWSLLIFSVAAWYCSQIFTGDDARPQPFYFPVLPQYWLPRCARLMAARSIGRLKQALREVDVEAFGLDSDVADEFAAICGGRHASVTLLNISKTFAVPFVDGIPLISSVMRVACARPFPAVKGVCVEMREGAVFALLGHNGAGKTTAIKMVTAQLQPSAGDVEIHGLSVNLDAVAVRELLGICPQHDVLYDELSAADHLWIYGAIKGLSRAQLKRQIGPLLASVRLENLETRPVSGFSGGMKRRLSLATSLVGNPQVMILDEPTTGMDPMNRKYVWDAVNHFKVSRTVLLTTHSMEEADALGDRIGIMSRGQLVALGGSLHLKHKFGEGYSVTLVAKDGGASAHVQKQVQELIPTSKLVEDNAGSMVFSLPDDAAMHDAPNLFRYLESTLEGGGHGDGESQEARLIDWSISHTTLEDVFLRLAKDDEQFYVPEMLSVKAFLPVDGSWTPGLPWSAVAHADGLLYNVPGEALPNEARWKEMKEEKLSWDPEATTVAVRVKVPKRLKVPIRALAHARVVRMVKVNKDTRVGITFEGEPPSAPVIAALTEDGLAAQSGALSTGDRVLAVNSTLVQGHAMATELIKSTVGELQLAVKDARKGGEHENGVLADDESGRRVALKGNISTQHQLRALLTRTVRIQRRQRCFCMGTVMVPLACLVLLILFQKLVVEGVADLLAGRVTNWRYASSLGCGNVTQIMSSACQSRASTAVTGSGTYETCSFCELSQGTRCGISWLTRDQCVSSAAENENPSFDLNCIAGPGMNYEEESLLPGWCNCTSESFSNLVAGTAYCTTLATIDAALVRDNEPTKVIRDIDDRSGYRYYAQATGRSTGTWITIPDAWNTYIGWRISIISPSSLQVGELNGTQTDSGYLGLHNQTTEASPSLAELITPTASGQLLPHFPHGIADTRPSSLDDWRERRQCHADGPSLQCCVKRRRRLTNANCEISGCGCQQEAALPEEEWFCNTAGSFARRRLGHNGASTGITSCRAAWSINAGGRRLWQSSNASKDGLNAAGMMESAKQYLPQGRRLGHGGGGGGGPPAITQCPAGPVTCEGLTPAAVGDVVYEMRTFRDGSSCTESREIAYDIDWSTSARYCHGETCHDTTCEATGGTNRDGTDAFSNPRCRSVISDMAEHCNTVKEEVRQACEAGSTWSHPYDPTLLTVLWTTFATGNAPRFQPRGVQTQPGAMLTTAFEHARQWFATTHNVSASAYSPLTQCAPPFCIDFDASNVGGGKPQRFDATLNGGTGGTVDDCSWEGGALNSTLAPLDWLYPCFGTHATNITDTMYDAHDSLPEYTACNEAYSYMAVVYTDAPDDGLDGWLRVPECAPASLDGVAYTSCATCKPATCPRFHHYVTPIYTQEQSIDDVMQRVLQHQLAVRDGSSAVPGPTQPTVEFGISNELEKLFPSVALEFIELDVARVRAKLRVASFWGDSPDWTYVRAPSSWPVRDAGPYSIVKFPRGIAAQRWFAAGGMASTLQNWYANSLMKASMGENYTITTGMKPFPYELTVDQWLRNISDIYSQFAQLVDVVVPLGTTCAVPLLVSGLVIEKEHKLRSLMLMMGVKMRWYWLCEWLWSTSVVSTINFAFVLGGWAAGIGFMLRSTGTLVLLVILWSQSLVSLAMLLSCFYTRVLTANIINFFLVIALVLISLALNQVTWPLGTDVFPTGLFLISPLAYYRAVHLLATRTYELAYLSDEMSAILGMLFLDAVLYALLAQYLDAVMPRQFGVALEPLFFLRRLRELISGKPNAAAGNVLAEHDVDDNEDSDVALARAAVDSDGTGSSGKIISHSLRKVYKGGKVLAVRDLTFAIDDGECFGLLGPNGAGKTTAISMWTGLYPPSSGTATICGYSLRTGMAAIYERIGVCPQFDILWPLLTVIETLTFYAQVKGLPKSQWRYEAAASAASVDLGHVTERLVSRLSGGMRRRVSLAISLVGGPEVVFLDEPTTGLDPETKRAMWTLIDLAKAQRSIVLTTHSMEEADALCSRIGIMAHGSLRCLGPSLHLKRKFGAGFHVEISYTQGKRDDAITFVQSLLPSSTLAAESAAAITFLAPRGATQLSALFESMQKRPESAGVSGWALRQTSMEEVFLRIAREAEAQFLSDLPVQPPSKTWRTQTQGKVTPASRSEVQMEAVSA